MTRTITAQWLLRNGACPDQVRKFRRVFPRGTAPTQAAVLKAVKAGMGIGWLERFIPATAWAEYNRVMAPASAEYNRVTAPALSEYDRVKAPAWAEYKRVMATAWAEYERVKATALAIALKGVAFD